jgi:hypothetical protein
MKSFVRNNARCGVQLMKYLIMGILYTLGFIVGFQISESRILSCQHDETHSSPVVFSEAK